MTCSVGAETGLEVPSSHPESRGEFKGKLFNEVHRRSWDDSDELEQDWF